MIRNLEAILESMTDIYQQVLHDLKETDQADTLQNLLDQIDRLQIEFDSIMAFCQKKDVASLMDPLKKLAELQTKVREAIIANFSAVQEEMEKIHQIKEYKNPYNNKRVNSIFFDNQT